MSSNSELTVLPNVFSWLTDNCGEYSLYIQDHRYGAGYCAAIVPTELVPVIDNLTTGGDSYVPYVFSSYISRCGAKGLPVAYGESANAAVFELESQLDSFGEAENDHYRLEKWHPAFELFRFLDSIKDKDHYEDDIHGWPLLKKGGQRPLQARELLQALGNPAGWVVSPDRNGFIEATRTLESNGRSATLAAPLFVSARSAQDVQKLRATMAACVEVVDDQLARHIGVTAELLSFTNEHGFTFIDDTSENKAVLAELRAQCRFATAEEVAA